MSKASKLDPIKQTPRRFSGYSSYHGVGRVQFLERFGVPSFWPTSPIDLCAIPPGSWRCWRPIVRSILSSDHMPITALVDFLFYMQLNGCDVDPLQSMFDVDECPWSKTDDYLINEKLVDVLKTHFGASGNSFFSISTGNVTKKDSAEEGHEFSWIPESFRLNECGMLHAIDRLLRSCGRVLKDDLRSFCFTSLDEFKAKHAPPPGNGHKKAIATSSQGRREKYDDDVLVKRSDKKLRKRLLKLRLHEQILDTLSSVRRSSHASLRIEHLARSIESMAPGLLDVIQINPTLRLRFKSSETLFPVNETDDRSLDDPRHGKLIHVIKKRSIVHAANVQDPSWFILIWLDEDKLGPGVCPSWSSYDNCFC